MRKTSDGFWKRGKIWWCRLAGKRVSTGCKDLDAAKLWRAREERAIADPAYAAAHQEKVSDAVDAFNAELKRAKRAEGTIDFYSRRLGHIERVFGSDATLSTVHADSVSDYVDTRVEEGASPQTIKKELATLFQVLGLAKHRGRYNLDPRDVMPRKFDGAYVPRTRFLTRDEVTRLLAALEPHRAAWVAYAIATGARLSEVNRAQVGDVDWKRGTVQIRGTKTKSSKRTIPIVSITRDLLKRAEKDADGGGKAEDGGTLLFSVWPGANISQTLKRACRGGTPGARSSLARTPRADIPRCSPNDFRRTLASWLVQSGVPSSLVGFMLGHTTSAMVERVYGKMTPKAAGDLLQKALSPTPSKPRKARKTKRAAKAAKGAVKAKKTGAKTVTDLYRRTPKSAKQRRATPKKTPRNKGKQP